MHGKAHTDFLFAQPSFVSGAARLLDLYGLFDRYNESATTFEADYRALLSDWCMVGQDIRNAMAEFEHLTAHEPLPDPRQIEMFSVR